MKRKFKRILSLLMSFTILMGTFVFTGNAENVSSGNVDGPNTEVNGDIVQNILTKTSSSTNDTMNILHMDRTVSINPDGGYDVELSSFLDGVIQTETNAKEQGYDVVFTLDVSDSMPASGFTDIENAIRAIQKELKKNPNNRIGFNAFSCEVLTPYTPDLISVNSNIDTYMNLYKGHIANPFNWGTATRLALERAYNKIMPDYDSDKENPNRNKPIYVLMTDGAPGPFGSYEEGYAKRALEASSTIKKGQDGVYGTEDDGTIFVVKTFFDDEKGKTEVKRFCDYVSSAYGPEAIDPNKTYTYKTLPANYVIDAANTAAVQDAVGKLLRAVVKDTITKWLYPLKLDENSITQDVISPYFKLSETPTYEIQTAKFNTDGSHIESDWTSGTVKNAKVDGQRIYVDNFDYVDNCVAYLNKESSKRLVIKYHIDPIENFFGGNNVSTNVPCSADDGTENVDYLTNGSGIYCDGDFFMDFEDIGVNISLNPGTVKFNSIDNAPFLSTQVPDDQVEITKFDETYIDGINNAYVDISINGGTENATISRTENNILFQEAGTSFGKTNVMGGEGSNYNKEYIAGNYTNVSLFNPTGYQVEKNETFKVKMNITPSMPAANVKVYETVGAPVEAIEIASDGYINTEAKYIATFSYEYGEYAEGVVPSSLVYEDGTTPVEVPNSVTANSFNTILNYVNNDISPAIGAKAVYKDGATTYNYVLSGWTKTNERKDADTGVIYIEYTGKWKYTDSEVEETPFTVEIYYMDTKGKYNNTTPDEVHNFMAKTNSVAKIGYRNIYDDKNFFVFVRGESAAITSDQLEENYDVYSANGLNNFYGYQVMYNTAKSDSVSYSDVLAYTKDFYVCSSCYNLITEYTTDSKNNIYCSHCPDWYAIRYSDFALDSNLSNTSITINENVSQNKIKLYFERQKHSITINVVNEETHDEPQTYTLTGYAGASMSDTFVNDKAYRSVLYAADNITPVEKTKYYKITKDSLYYFNERGEVFSDSFSGYYVNVRDLFENYKIFNNLIPFHNTEMTITLTPIYTQGVVQKSWGETAKDNNLQQNCIFTLYEIDNNGDATKITQFTIQNTSRNIRKSIPKLRVGKTYAVVEGQWSYKTAPSQNIIIEMFSSDNQYIFQFTNNAAETISGTTCDKGLVNLYSTDGTITQTAITK